MKRIGIVGGVGPLAGIDLQRKIVAQTRAERDQDHLEVVSVSFPGQIPDRTEFLLGTTQRNPAQALADQLRLLEQAGAEIGAIPCNTAHAPAIFDEILRILRESRRGIVLLNLLDEVCAALAARFAAGTRIGLLSTLGTYRSGWYAAALTGHGFETLVPDEDGQGQVHEAIYSSRYGVKAQGPTEPARVAVGEVIRQLKDAGAQAVILGCTELPILLPERRVAGLAAVDPTLILARAAVREAAPGRLAPEAEM